MVAAVEPGQQPQPRAEPGQVIKVGRPILTYSGDGEEAAPEAAAEKKERRSKKAAAAKAETPPMPTGNGPKVAAPLATLAVKAAPSVRLTWHVPAPPSPA